MFKYPKNVYTLKFGNLLGITYLIAVKSTNGEWKRKIQQIHFKYTSTECQQIGNITKNNQDIKAPRSAGK